MNELQALYATNKEALVAFQQELAQLAKDNNITIGALKHLAAGHSVSDLARQARELLRKIYMAKYLLAKGYK